MPERILIADDNAHMVELLATILPDWGYRVTSARDGLEALQSLEISLPDLILMDIEMPGLGGSEVCRRLKAHPERRDIPVMLISGRSDVAVQAKIAGADGFLSKPFSLGDLQRQVGLLLSSVAREAAA
jgi:CheY-like chemotaxis protein